MRYAVLGGTAHALITAASMSARTGSRIAVGVDRPVRLKELDGHPIEVESEHRPQADAYVVVSDAADLLAAIGKYADLLAGRPVLLVAPGVGGSALVRDLLVAAGLEPPQLAETNANPFIGTTNGATATIRATKRGLLAGDLQPDGPPAADVFSPALELAKATASEASLANTNHVLHPAVTLANLTRIDAASPFTLFREGMSAATERLIVATDNERATLAHKLSLPYTSVADWFTTFYGDQGCLGDTLTDAFAAFPPFATAPGPNTLNHRFLTDEVTCGLAVLEQLARHLGTPVPVTTATVTALSTATATDLRAGTGVRAKALLASIQQV